MAFGEDDEDEALFDSSNSSASAESGPFTFVQILTVVLMVGLIGSVVVLAAFGKEPDIGLLCFLFGAILSLADPQGKAALPKIDWSTVLLVGGIITFVGVLQNMGAVDLLGEGAEAIGSPLIAAFVLCIVGGLVSAFASTTGILAALVPLALPLIAAGGVPVGRSSRHSVCARPSSTSHRSRHWVPLSWPPPRRITRPGSRASS